MKRLDLHRRDNAAVPSAARPNAARPSAARPGPWHIERLEPRILLSADPFGSAGGDPAQPHDYLLTTASDHLLQELAALPPIDAPPVVAPPAGTPQPLDLDPLAANDHVDAAATLWPGDPVEPAAARGMRTELIFVDTSAPDHEQLLEAVRGAEDTRFYVVTIDAHSDGLDAVSQTLAIHDSVDAIHLIGHGAADELRLGAVTLSGDNLAEHAAQLSGWREHLAPDADLLLYGCNLAATPQGEWLLDQIADLTAADVAASDDVTGHALLGGDWMLEYRHGDVATPLAFDAARAAQWLGSLGSVEVTTHMDVADGDTSSVAALQAAPGQDGLISLREAILAANNTPNQGDPDVITFALDSSHTIALQAALPTIDEALFIDGSSDSGPLGEPLVVLDGSNLSGGPQTGLVLTAGDSTVQSLIITGFSGDGIRITQADGNNISGNWIGIASDGVTAAGNGGAGIAVDSAASNTIIGNAIAGNGGPGIALSGASAQHNRVFGNTIGTTADGTGMLGNGTEGIWIYGGASNNTIGATTDGDGNLIAGNMAAGVRIDGAGGGNAVQGNAIYANGGLAIDLGGDGSTANDGDDADAGPNTLQNHPSITLVDTDGSTLRFKGTLQGAANSDFTLDFYGSDAGDPPASLGGRQYLGATTVTTDATGLGTFEAYLPADLLPGSLVTATATSASGDTSEFSDSATALYNNPPTVTQLATIGGLAKEGELLYLINTFQLSDPDGPGTLNIDTYWMRDDERIASGAYYTLGQEDVGHTISVVAQYTDATGRQTTVWSAPSSPVANVNDAPSGQVTITGTPAQGGTLSADTSTLTDADVPDPAAVTYQYQWYRDADLVGTGRDYVLTQADVGQPISVVVNYTDAYAFVETGTTTPALTASIPAGIIANVNDAPSGQVAITGSLAQGGTLSADTSTLADADVTDPAAVTYQYQWYRGADPVGSGRDYVLTQADVGQPISVVVSYTDGYAFVETGTTTPALTASIPAGIIANVNDAPSGQVAITGTLAQGGTLSADTSTLADADVTDPAAVTYQYQWYRGADPVGSGRDYVLTQADVGQPISVVVSYTDGYAFVETGATTPALTASTPAGIIANVNDAPSGQVAITGTLAQGGTLSADTATLADADITDPAAVTYQYQWYRGSDPVGSGRDYVLTQADVGQPISVVVSYTDGYTFVETGTTTPALTASIPAGIIANVNDAPSGQVAITGSLAQGGTLSADTATLADADVTDPAAVTLQYQWYRGADPVGSGRDYVLTQADVGQPISVVVSYTDGYAFVETGTTTPALTASIPAGIIANVNDAPSATLRLPTTAVPGQTLTLDIVALSDADGLGTTRIEWYLKGQPDQPIGFGASFTPGQDHTGRSIYAVVRYQDDWGTWEAPRSNDAVVGLAFNEQPATRQAQAWPRPSGDAPPDDDEDTVTPPAAISDGKSAAPAEGSSPRQPAALLPPGLVVTEPGGSRPFPHLSDSAISHAFAAPAPLDAPTLMAAALPQRVADPIETVLTASISPDLTEVARGHLAHLVNLDFAPGDEYSKALRTIQDDIVQEAATGEALAGTTMAVSAGVSVGYLAWLTRSGVLLGSVLSAMPAWRLVDPLPILQKLAEADPDADEESLQSLVDTGHESAERDQADGGSAQSTTARGAQHALE